MRALGMVGMAGLGSGRQIDFAGKHRKKNRSPLVLGLVLVAVSLLLSACGYKEYYVAQEKLYQMMIEQERTRRALIEKREATPLFHHSYTDLDGNEHEITVNQPMVGNDGEARSSGSHMVTLPSPGEMTFKYVDRGLTTIEKIFPFLAPYLFGEGNDSSSKTTYEFGDSVTFFQTTGDNSALTYAQDNSTKSESTTTVPE